MKKIIFIIFICLFIMPIKANALNFPYIDPNICSNAVGVGEATLNNEETGVININCFNTYEEALSNMNNTPNDNLVMIKNGQIIYAKYGVIDYDIDFSYKPISTISTSNLESVNSSDKVGYIRTAGNYSDDAVLIDYDFYADKAKVKVSGATYWINKYQSSVATFEVVPLIWAKNLTHYVVNDDSITHYFPQNIKGNNNEISYTLDSKPTMLNNGTYYSYDGNYFYTDMKVLINDYKNNTFSNAVNSNIPYYNYYQYLNLRSKTHIDANNLNLYISKRVSNESVLLNTGELFIRYGEEYGVNPIIILSIALNESGGGTSKYAKKYNNLFGIGAVDANPDNAREFSSIEECIKYFASSLMSYDYMYPGDSRYFGALLGNKNVGFNIKYASDPYWSEKAAANYYNIDKMFAFVDASQNRYNLAVLNNNYNNQVFAYKSINGEVITNYSQILRRNYNYEYLKRGSSIIIFEEITDANGNLWYKVLPDPNLDQNLNFVGNSNNPILYNWNGYIYVMAKYFNKVGDIVRYNTNQTIFKPINEIVNSQGYIYKQNYISGIKLNTNVDIIKAKLISGAKDVVVKDINGNIKTGNLCTGDKIYITTDHTEELNVVIYGDTVGSNKISAVDYVRIKNHIMGSSILTGVFKEAADVNKDGNISAVDYVNIKNYIMGQPSVLN